MASKNSENLLDRATRVIPGGVNSPARAFEEVEGTPRFIESALGSRIFDADKLQHIDCMGAWGSMILGHAHRYVVEAVRRSAMKGFTYGAATQPEIEIAEMISAAFPSIEKVRLVDTGTTAIANAIRLARAATGRDLILKFDAGFHGGVDATLIEPGSGPERLGEPGSPGVPKRVAAMTVTVPYNDSAAVEDAFALHGEDLAAVVVEPVASGIGCIPPQQGFLQKLRELCDGKKTLLIFDEVVTGFRVAWGGAQELFDVVPDITCLGRIIGGGLPLGAFGASADLMDLLRPDGPVVIEGVGAGNSISVAAGLSTLSILRNGPIYKDLEMRTSEFEKGVLRAATDHGIPVAFNRVGSMWTIFFSEDPVTDLESAKKSKSHFFSRFFNLMLGEGVHLPPSQFETAFFSAAHARKDIQQIVERVNVVFKRMSREFEDELITW